ncbi:metal ABC transporter permease [Streptomyces sp. NPDC006692]|uniref:metal ABC transporter permease n=1 Tax=unclassified Streptomyces TaxID=2593676 RepID=UPI0036A3E745
MNWAEANSGWSWNPVADIQQIWAFPFMVNAFRAGTVVAVLAAVIGWYMVLRKQSFAGHTLSVISFPGAACATLLGVSAGLGYFAFCVGGALVIAAIPRSGQGGRSQESALTGTVQAFLLACGFLFVALYKGFLGGVNALLFGSFLGITTTQVAILAVVAALALGVLALIGRPLLFASVDGGVAAGRGVPVRILSVVFLVLLGAATAEASQITGTLLVFALLVMPAAAAQQLTARPALSLLAAVLIAVLVTWCALITAYYSPYPIGFYVTTFAFGVHALARTGRALAGTRPPVPEEPANTPAGHAPPGGTP